MYFNKLFEDGVPSVGAGIGTAAGFAWPPFGIIFGALGLAIGGTAAIALGAICISVFLFVALPVTYWSFQSLRKEKANLARTHQEQEIKLHDFFSQYLLTLLKDYPLYGNLELKNIPSEILVTHLHSMLLADSQKKELNISPDLKTFLYHTLQFHPQAKNFLLVFADTYKNKATANINIQNNPCLAKQLNDLFVNHFANTKPSYAPQIKAGVGGFFAAFGSIAGCCAGTYGMLVGIGVFAGLTAIPIAGWIALGAAVLFGLTVAGICAYAVYKKNKQTQLIANYTKINHEVEMINLTKKNIAIENKLRRTINNNANINTLTVPENKSKRPTQTRSEDFLPSVQKYSLCHSWNNQTEKSNQAKSHVHTVPTFKAQ